MTKIKTNEKVNLGGEIDENFFKGLFDQIQMSLNLNKLKMYDSNLKKITKNDYLKEIDKFDGKRTIDLNFYNLSVKDKSTILSKIYKKKISSLYNKIETIYSFSKKSNFSDEEGNFKEKIMIIDFDLKNHTLNLFTPFAVKNNVGNFYEFFGTEIDNKENLKFNYLKINGFKLTLTKNTNSLENKMNEQGVKKILKGREDEVKIYFIKY